MYIEGSVFWYFGHQVRTELPHPKVHIHSQTKNETNESPAPNSKINTDIEFHSFITASLLASLFFSRQGELLIPLTQSMLLQLLGG
jgi:hypothetical protein